MDPVSIASGIAGLITLALQVGDTVNTYVTAIRSRSQDIKELHDELLLLGDVLSRLRNFLQSEQATGSTFDEDSVLHLAISDCKARIERIGDKLKPSEGGKLARAVDRFKWPFEQKEILQMMENLRRYRSTFEFAVGIQGCKILSKASQDASKGLQQMLELSKKTEEMCSAQGLVLENAAQHQTKLEQLLTFLPMLNSTADGVREVSHAVRLAEVREQERRTTDILNWLAPIENLHKHRDVQARRAVGTGQHFLQMDKFQWWIQSNASDMLCTGAPGVGKSVLSSLVIDELKSKFKATDTIVVYYYCDYAEQQEQTSLHMTCTVLRQLCASLGTIPSAVADFYQKTRNEVRDQTWFQELQTVLRRVIATASTCYLIIDALDETEGIKQRGDLLALVDVMRSASGQLKVFATARPHLANIESRFTNPIVVQVTAQEADLRIYLSGMIDAHPDADHVMDPALKREVLDRLCENANGMFLLPSLHIRDILDQPTRGDIRRSLQNLSTDLTAVFSSTIDRIKSLPNSRLNVAMRSLMWISHTSRPLKSAELQHALALRPGDKSLNSDDILSVRTIIDSCFGLLEIERDSNTIRLVHFSFEEYLQSQDHGLFESANLTILRTCLQYMSMSSVKPLPFKNRTDFAKEVKELPFLEYACLEWGSHAKIVPVAQYEDIALPLLVNGPSLLTIARVRDARSPDFRRWRERMWAWALSSNGGAAISLAASYGLTDLLRLLLSQHTEPNLLARNMYGSTPLHECAVYGHEQAAELLIAHGADLLDHNKGQATPFFLAISYGRLSMARLLLKYSRAQLDSHCKSGMTPLMKAVEVGSESLVEFLLQQGALVAAHDWKHRTALHHAAAQGNVNIARMLVLAGALVHVPASQGLTPLDLAATAGHRDVTEYLIDNGADISHKAEDRWNVLHRAARGGHVDNVVLLLEVGAETLEQDYRGNIPLHHAVRSGHLQTVSQLLEYEPALRQEQLFARDIKENTPREVAFYCAQYHVHKYLRSVEWEVLGTVPGSSSKITTAIETGDLTTINYILSSEPKLLEQPDEDGQPPLHVAIQESQSAIAHHLLACGANIESIGFHGWRPLHIASSLGNFEIVQLCITHNASVTTRTSTQQTCLHKAASSHSLPVIRHLIASGADINARNDRGMTALHVAAHQNSLRIVRALVLEYGMDVMQTDKTGATAANWAEKAAHTDVLAFLKGEEKGVKSRAGEEAAGKRWQKRWSKRHGRRDSLLREQAQEGVERTLEEQADVTAEQETETHGVDDDVRPRQFIAELG